MWESPPIAGELSLIQISAVSPDERRIDLSSTSRLYCKRQPALTLLCCVLCSEQSGLIMVIEIRRALGVTSGAMHSESTWKCHSMVIVSRGIGRSQGVLKGRRSSRVGCLSPHGTGSVFKLRFVEQIILRQSQTEGCPE